MGCFGSRVPKSTSKVNHGILASQNDAIGTKRDAAPRNQPAGERLWFEGASEFGYRFLEGRGFNRRSTPDLTYFFSATTF